MLSGPSRFPCFRDILVQAQGHRGGKYMCSIGKGGLTYTGRILLHFLFLTAFPRAVTAVAQLPVGENLGHRVSTCHNRQSEGGKVSEAAVQAEP